MLEMIFNFGVEYIWEGVFNDVWDLCFCGDYYYQVDFFSWVWNILCDVFESWDNVNLFLQFMNIDNDWLIEVFGKNIIDEEVIIGVYFIDDSFGLFMNVFLIELLIYGVIVFKCW